MIKVDWTYATDTAVGDRAGINVRELDAMGSRAREVHADLVQAREQGQLGFWDLAAREADAKSVREAAKRIRGEFEWLVVLGIGGSSLGLRTILDAFCPASPFTGRKGCKVIVVDNIDPERLERLDERIDWKTAAVNVVSKSGNTPETAAQFIWMKEKLAKAVGPEKAKKRIFATTDKSKGLLRPMADKEGYPTFSVPDNVGGRFSVLTPVGLLPAAAAGIDPLELVAGAADMAARCDTPDLEKNPGYLLGALHYLADTKKKQNVSVMFCYADALLTFAEWYKQLWGESLGKRKDKSGKDVFVGQTPVTALGPTDQHSILQLLMEGPFDKLITFLSLEKFRAKVTMPKGAAAEPYPYLGGRTFNDLLAYEREAVATALAQEGRPSLTVRLDELTPAALGSLFFLYEAATAFGGGLYGVDAFDQPGVEAGKNITYGLLGRPGYEAQKAAYEAFRAKVPPRIT
jgi:glucose-6-phosphate isomerase